MLTVHCTMYSSFINVIDFFPLQYRHVPEQDRDLWILQESTGLHGAGAGAEDEAHDPEVALRVRPRLHAGQGNLWIRFLKINKTEQVGSFLLGKQIKLFSKHSLCDFLKCVPKLHGKCLQGWAIALSLFRSFALFKKSERAHKRANGSFFTFLLFLKSELLFFGLFLEKIYHRNCPKFTTF